MRQDSVYAYGCQADGLVDISTLSLEAPTITPYDVRGWFAMEGWRFVLGPGGSESLMDYCSVHQTSVLATQGGNPPPK